MTSKQEVATSWDAEYARGLYRNQPPLPFVDDIVAAARRQRVSDRPGLYIGCGNGRNYLPMLSSGLDLIGLDVSEVAISQLTELVRKPDRLVHGDLASLPRDDRYGLVVGIQVFQHGDREGAHQHIAEACARVDTQGLLAMRVNAADTQLEFEHEVVERPPDGSFTARYLEGPKRGLLIHFFTRDELSDLMKRPSTSSSRCAWTARNALRLPRATGRNGKSSGVGPAHSVPRVASALCPTRITGGSRNSSNRRRQLIQIDRVARHDTVGTMQPLGDAVDSIAERTGFSGVVRVDRSDGTEFVKAYRARGSRPRDRQHDRHAVRDRERDQGLHGADGHEPRRGRLA